MCLALLVGVGERSASLGGLLAKEKDRVWWGALGIRLVDHVPAQPWSRSKWPKKSLPKTVSGEWPPYRQMRGMMAPALRVTPLTLPGTVTTLGHDCLAYANTDHHNPPGQPTVEPGSHVPNAWSALRDTIFSGVPKGVVHLTLAL